MSKLPSIVTTEWLAERLNDQNLRLLDASTFLKHPEKHGYYDVWSGKEAYEKGHIPGAVFADLIKSFPMLIQNSPLLCPLAKDL